MILVCGGAGYIGSHCTLELIRRGYKVAVLDDLSTGYRDSIDDRAIFYEGKIQNDTILNEIFTSNEIEAVVHFAANSLVAESMKNPIKYYKNNVSGTINLVEKMIEYDVKKMVFSSTASVYGNAKECIITEEVTPDPTNVYGETKLTIEKMLKCVDDANDFKSIVFRYFNVAGADKNSIIGESHYPETHLIPIILQVAQGKREKLSLFGNDYDTKDGTCIRDYIHVTDLVDAHILALDKLIQGSESNVYNLGNGKGFTNLEIIEAVREVTCHSIPVEIMGRRAGDPDSLIADYNKAKSELGWNPKYTKIKDIIDTAWKWHKSKPNGFRQV